MKKLTLVMIAAILVMFLGCSKSSDSPTSPSTTSPVAGTWNMASENGVPLSGFTMTIVINNDGTWTYTTTGATSSIGAPCTGSGTSSTSGSNLTIVTTAENCPDTGETYPNTEINTYTVTATTLTMTTTGKITVFTKQ